MTNHLLSADNICVTRDGNNILDNVSLHIAKQDFITLIGPNGAGKSMLLKCLLEFYQPDSGEIRRKPDLKIGYVPQRLIAEPTMPISVQRFLQLRKKSSPQELQEILLETDTLALVNKPLSVLSGGEMQRVLLARALLDSPDLLVLDEPAQNLDISGQLAFYKRLDFAFSNRDISILMVSHDLHMVMSSTKQVVCLYHHICCSGKPEVITKDPEFISLFGEDMAKMMSVYHHSHDHQHDHSHNHNHQHNHG
jgi:zinc transport system ATP-binding protein